jgi:hypothetical protein
MMPGISDYLTVQAPNYGSAQPIKAWWEDPDKKRQGQDQQQQNKPIDWTKISDQLKQFFGWGQQPQRAWISTCMASPPTACSLVRRLTLHRRRQRHLQAAAGIIG